MRAVVSACLVAAFALVVGGFFLAQGPAPRPDSPGDATVSTDANDSATEQSPDTATDTNRDVALDVELGYVHDEVLLSIEPGTSADSINKVLASCDFAATRDVSDQDLSAGYVSIELADGADVKDSVTTLKLSGLKAQPNFVYQLAENSGSANSVSAVQPASTNADGAVTPQAAVSINDPQSVQQWALDSVNAYNAWGIEKCGDKGGNRVSVAVIDTGAQINHPDLKNNVVAHYNSATKKNLGREDDVDDESGHGTHVAGIVSAEANNGQYVAGVSYNAGLVIIKASYFGEDQEGNPGHFFDTADIANAYNWLFSAHEGVAGAKSNAEFYNVRVINMSLGAKQETLTTEDEVLMSCIDSARQGSYTNGENITTRFPSILTVTAAGNNPIDGPYISNPGDFANGISVINLKKTDNWTTSNNSVARDASSNYNVDDKHVKNISAPGTSILSLSNTSNVANATGTSMAAPCVAGIAALIFSENPKLNASQVADIIEATATDIDAAGWDRETGYGEIDAYHALQVTSASLVGDDTIQRSENGSVKMLYGDGTAWGDGGSPSDWSWSVDKSNIIEMTVTDSGDNMGVSFVGKEPGTATITATLKDADGNADTGITLSKSVTVTGLDISSASVSKIDNSYTYTGKAISPTPTVVYGSTTLTKGSDYTVSYKDNVNAGTATVIIKGAGKCSGTITKTFTINPASISTATFGTVGSYPYNGNVITPKPAVSLGDFGVLSENKDFTYEYQNNKNAGNAAQIRVVGKGNFEGATEWGRCNFTISKLELQTATVTIAPQRYTGKELKPKATVIVNSITLKEGTDYDIIYRNNTNPGTATAVITAKNDGNYSGFKNAEFDIVNPITRSMITINDAPTYTGHELKPNITVRDGNKVLKEGTDYRIVNFWNNVNAGTDSARADVVGLGNYHSSGNYVRIWYAIKPVSLSGATVKIPSQTYTGSAITPNPTVTMPGHGTLTKEKDYTVQYSNNVNVGTASATVIGRGNYTGSLKQTFSIAKSGATNPDGREMYRLYNPNSGEHFYTADASERDNLKRVGWAYEGVGWTAPKTSKTPVYRLYSGTDHHYTMDASERDNLVRVGWRYEGIGWYSDDGKRVPLYRQFNPNVNPSAPRNNSGSHNYTKDLAEHNRLVAIGWKGEGVGWYGM